LKRASVALAAATVPPDAESPAGAPVLPELVLPTGDICPAEGDAAVLRDGATAVLPVGTVLIPACVATLPLSPPPPPQAARMTQRRPAEYRLPDVNVATFHLNYHL
jgi:hypothetical protein